MQQITPINYIKIAVANAYGKDKCTWDERIEWFNANNILCNISNAKEPLLMQKALHAYYAALAGEPTGFIMGLDATASGIQIMSALIGDHIGASNCNLVDTGKREDVYETVGKYCTQPRDVVKKPVMTTFYGSRLQPEGVFGEGTPELANFYKALEMTCPGAMEVLHDIQSCWQPYALKHEFTLPDGHTAIIKNMVPVDKKIEIDEMNHATFTHRAYINQGQETGLSLAANVIHGVDGYIVREMYRRAQLQGFELLTIHDSFWASPNYMQNVRQNYADILGEIADANLLESILREITGNKYLVYQRLGEQLGDKIRTSEYALS